MKGLYARETMWIQPVSFLCKGSLNVSEWKQGEGRSLSASCDLDVWWCNELLWEKDEGNIRHQEICVCPAAGRTQEGI